jgi:signal transduction histidine kinase
MEYRLMVVQKEKVVLLSDIVNRNIELLMLENRWNTLEKHLENLTASNPELTEVRIFHPVTGRIIVSANRDDTGKQINKQDWEKFSRKDETPFITNKDKKFFATRVKTIRNSPLCYRCHPPEKEILGAMDLELSLVTATRLLDEAKYKNIVEILAASGLVIIAFFIGGEIFIKQPLKKLVNTMKSVESGDLSVRAKEDSIDEFGYLARSLNAMIIALESSKNNLEACQIQEGEKSAKLASLGGLITGVIHEIKNPLSGISFGVQTIYSDLSDTDERKATIIEIMNHVNRLNKTVKDVLNYAKPKPPNLIKSRIDDIMEKALFLAYFEAKKQNVVIRTEIEGEVAEVMADPEQIQLVFINLMVNALQAISGDGMITISISEKDYREVEREVSRPSGSDRVVVIRFQDTGGGIAPGDLKHVFDPFFTTKKSKGTGLGLSISRKIVLDHGGDIGITSEFGKGSVVSVYLPSVHADWHARKTFPAPPDTRREEDF